MRYWLSRPPFHWTSSSHPPKAGHRFARLAGVGVTHCSWRHRRGLPCRKLLQTNATWHTRTRSSGPRPTIYTIVLSACITETVVLSPNVTPKVARFSGAAATVGCLRDWLASSLTCPLL